MPAAPHPPSPPPARSWLAGWWLRDARIRAKLTLILLVPLLAIGALATARLVDSAARVTGADLAATLVTVAAEVSEVGHQLHRERIEAIGLLTNPDRDPGGFHRQAADTDQAIASYQAAVAGLGPVPPAAGTRLAAIGEQLAALDGLRQHVTGAQPGTATAAVLLRYTAVLSDIGAYHDALAGVIDDPVLSEQARAVAAISRAKAHAADAEALAHTAATAGRLTTQGREALRATQTGQQEAFVAFRQAASPPQQALVDAAITGANVDAAATATTTLLHPDSGGSSDQVVVAAAGLGGMVDVSRFVEQQLHQQLLESVTRTRDTVWGQVLAESAAVIAAVLLAVLVALLLARMLATSLRRLRDGAVTVAQHELPAAVARLSDPQALAEHDPAELAEQVRPPGQAARGDEIGQVAYALHQVHQAAVRTAAQQAALRTSVAAMFLNLARRSQTLVDHMITRLDALQRDETDHDRLQQMFALDNLATRMRRNDENLLVLAGADTSPPRHRPAQVADVLQAAQSEIEHYQRVEFGTVDDDIYVTAAAINDIVRLVAELLDNATRFSPPHASVVCEARRLGDRLLIHIEDRGVGITDTDIATLNTWLAHPGELDVTAFRRMGIAVVARLAARHHIDVHLQAHPHHGTTATITLPPGVLILPTSRHHHPDTMPPPPPAAADFAAAPASVPARHPGQLPRRPTKPGTGSPTSYDLPLAATSPPPAASDTAPTRMPNSGMPVAGRPAHSTGSVASPGPQTIELPIFQQVETAWFRDHGDHGPTWTSHQPAPAPGAGTSHLSQTPAPGSESGDQDTVVWRTAADTGWAAAAAAAHPNPGGTTTTGLPRRVPQAQLVPGGVHPPPASGEVVLRRTPEQVRGLLSAYQRGVQRGRNAQP